MGGNDEASKQKMVSAIQISRMEYETLSAINEADRSVAQHISVMVWDMMEQGRKSRDAARREAEALRQSLETTKSEMADLQHMWEQQQRTGMLV